MRRRRRLWARFRSAITGRFVTRRFGRSHPDTTVRERIDDPRR